jgi:hypothetical protein
MHGGSVIVSRRTAVEGSWRGRDVPATLAYRGDGSDRPGAIQVPPSTAPALRGRRIRKYWRYVGVWGPDLLIGAARVHVGTLTQEFWAIWVRRERLLRERTRLSSGRVNLTSDGLRIRDGDVRVDLDLASTDRSGFEVVTPVGGSWTWTRKALTRATGRVRLGDRWYDVDSAAMLDDNGGYHPRRTHWWWSAGAGTLLDGRSAMWNAVVGLNDTPPHIENTVWVDGTTQPIGPVEISRDLVTTRFDDGNSLTFHNEVERTTNINLILLRSSYRAPFGRFTGTLPGGLVLSDGFGVMEDHHALW